MFNCGDLIVYGNNGVCRVEEITEMSLTGGEEQLYYVLKSKTGGGTAYVPVNSPVYMRPVMSQQEAEELVRQIPFVKTDCFEVSNARDMQKLYRETIQSHDCVQIISLIKHIRRTEKKKQEMKKKLSSTEERFLEQAMKIINSELSVALNLEPQKLPEYIAAHTGRE